ncbi:MAG: hypothetical protein M3443_03670 [Actinomycetota bacterium]|nr:hypothetical protein [Actinomycetota bacterium]
MRTETDWIRDALSVPRFAPYLAKTGGDLRAAIQLYWWNVGVSAAFYAPLHCLEMTLRNAVHQQLAVKFGRIDWWEIAPLNKSGFRVVGDTRSKLATRARPSTADDMVAELSFGFWVSFVSNTYHRSVWVPCLHKAFPFYRGRRGPLHSDLHTMLLFRNRIMHHEPIHHRHLEEDHRTILRLLGYLSSAMAAQLKPYDQVEAMLRQRPGSSSSAVAGGA